MTPVAESATTGNALPSRLRIALVHNHDPKRNDYAVPLLRQLAYRLNAHLDLVGWQPPLVSHSAATAFYRDWQYVKLEWNWAEYRNMGSRAKLRIALSSAAYRFPRYGRCGDGLARWRRMSAIETMVTAKHILVWRAFLESDAEVLMCCEDDIIFNPDSEALLAELVADATTTGLRYIDLAGGLPMAALGIGSLVQRTAGRQIFFHRATTNTACAYLLTRELAGHFLAAILATPRLRLVGVDWMMNALFIDLRSRGIVCDAMHFVPPLFAHGTFSGDYLSWQKLDTEGAETPTVSIMDEVVPAGDPSA